MGTARLFQHPTQASALGIQERREVGGASFQHTDAQPQQKNAREARAQNAVFRSGRRASFHPNLDRVAVCALDLDELAHCASPYERDDLSEVDALERLAPAAEQIQPRFLV